MFQPFQPTMDATVTVAASSVTASVKLGGQPNSVGSRAQYRIVNPGTTLAYVRFGDKNVTAAATDVPVLPGSAVIFSYSVPEGAQDGLYLAAILASGNATLSITTGAGSL